MSSNTIAVLLYSVFFVATFLIAFGDFSGFDKVVVEEPAPIATAPILEKKVARLSPIQSWEGSAVCVCYRDKTYTSSDTLILGFTRAGVYPYAFNLKGAPSGRICFILGAHQ